MIVDNHSDLIVQSSDGCTSFSRLIQNRVQQLLTNNLLWPLFFYFQKLLQLLYHDQLQMQYNQRVWTLSHQFLKQNIHNVYLFIIKYLSNIIFYIISNFSRKMENICLLFLGNKIIVFYFNQLARIIELLVRSKMYKYSIKFY